MRVVFFSFLSKRMLSAVVHKWGTLDTPRLKSTINSAVYYQFSGQHQCQNVEFLAENFSETAILICLPACLRKKVFYAMFIPDA